MKTLGRFVLVDNANKKQMYLQWKTTHGKLNRTSQIRHPIPMSYSHRKTIISELKPLDLNDKQTNATKNTKQIRASASTKQLAPFFYANPERQNTSATKTETKTFYRTRSVGKFSNQELVNSDKVRENVQKIRIAISDADRRKGRIISVLKMRRQGLRYKTTHQHFTLTTQSTHKQLTKQIKQKLFKQFLQIEDKKIYLFHLSSEPINNITTNIDSKQFVIFADILPKFSIPFELQMKLFQQAAILQQLIKSNLSQFQLFRQMYGVQREDVVVEQVGGKGVYQWEKIRDVRKYVDRLVDDPKQARKLRREDAEKDVVQLWCEQKYTADESKKGQKNPFFDLQCHYPKQSQTETLQKASQKINHLPTTKNRHQIRQRPLQNMMQKIKKQNQDALKLKMQENERIKTIGYKSEKQFLKQLDEKNIPLAYQNIPYMMEKYGINRAQAYNLYNLYKSLEKVSAMRLLRDNQFRRVKEKGVDRRTFDQGLQVFQINPGDQVIRNICYFPQFITWEEFIKIISISMRKTTKSKLQAILEGLGSTDKGYLTEDQIAIMVGSSLQKIFGQDEPELKKYFVSVVMKTLDKDKSGTIQIEQLKQHVLQKGIQNLDLVSYLMLNS